MTAKPLRDLKVLDLSKVLAGPMCARYLGDMGADVIKIEAPGSGDETRHMPPFGRDADGNKTGTIFLSVNRNKRGLALDLSQPAGRDVFYRLADNADVVIESYGPGVAARLGVDAATLRARNPRLVYCSISGFGASGPMRDAKGYDVILQAFCGMLAITGEPGGPPVRSPFSPIDQATGLHALVGILATLHERERTGLGGLVEAALFDTATGLLGYYLHGYWERGTEPEKSGTGHESLCPYGAFATADKPIMLEIANNGLWKTFCRVLELGSIVDDPRFRSNSTRVANRTEADRRVLAALSRRKRDEWLEMLTAAGVPCAPLQSIGEFAAHPHTAASGMVTTVNAGADATMRTVAQPLRFDGERTEWRRPPPALGADSHEILQAAGYSAAEIAALESSGAVGRTAPSEA